MLVGFQRCSHVCSEHAPPLRGPAKTGKAVFTCENGRVSEVFAEEKDEGGHARCFYIVLLENVGMLPYFCLSSTVGTFTYNKL